MSRSELGTRLIFGPLMLAIVGFVYWADAQWMSERGMGGVLVGSVLAFLGLAGVWEYVSMMRHARYPVYGALLLLASAGLFGTAFLSSWVRIEHEMTLAAALTFGLLFVAALASLAESRMERGIELLGGTLLGFTMIAWPIYIAQGLAMHHLPSVLFVVLVCKLGDIGAYLTGIAVGRHKLIPHISGGKTVEGSLGGVVFSCVAAALLAGPLLEPFFAVGVGAAVGLGFVLNLTTQTGDLIESLLKRRCGVKDSSQLLPAHGGVLDLIDSLLFSFPAYLVMLVIITVLT